jgi:propanol-preferring alcohol dehydrogenase
MQAMVLDAVGQPLEPRILPRPEPGPGQLLLRVFACGVCRTDLHVFDGDLTAPKLPLILGHEIVGEVVVQGDGAARFPLGARVGVPWLGHTCGGCGFCTSARENLCDAPLFTGYQRDGGFAEFAVADEAFCFSLPDAFDDLHAAPLLCAGLIGYRAYRMAGDGRRLGLYGFGAAAHLLAQLAVHQGREVYAFTKAGDDAGQAFARELGAVWAGDSSQRPPVELDAAILFAPVGSLVPAALRAVCRAGIVVCAGIHMSDIPSFPYEILWGERMVRSVANLTRRDGEEFLAVAGRTPLRIHVEAFALDEANLALERLRRGDLTGAAVLVPRTAGG